MSIKLNFWRRLLINLVYSVGLLVMIGLPAYFAIKEIYDNISFLPGNRLSLNWAVSGAFIMIVFAILYVKYFMKWFHRKLIGLQVRDELGIMPVKGILGIVSDRLLRTIEYAYPFGITLLVLYVSKYMFGQYQVFAKLYDMNIVLLELSLVGFGILLIGDFIKLAMMKQQEIINRLNLQVKTNRLELKQLKKQSKKAMAALAIERELKELKETDEEPEVEPIPEDPSPDA